MALTELQKKQIIGAKECKEGHLWNEIAHHFGVEYTVARAVYLHNKSKLEPLPCPLKHKSADAVDLGEELAITGQVLVEMAEEEIDGLWERAQRAQRPRPSPWSQEIAIPRPELPFAWAWISDLHLGGNTDYGAIRHDARVVRDTPRMWADFHGDATDNWVIAKLQSQQLGQQLNHDEEWLLFMDWLDIIGGKLGVVVSGNHDLWGLLTAAIDRVRDTALARKLRILYDRHEVKYVLRHGENAHRIKLRHKWRGASIFNVTHGIETSWERGGDDFDVGVGGHTHLGTVCRPFFRHGKIRHAILTGTYSLGDYGAEIGAAPTVGSGSGATIFMPDGTMQFFEDLGMAAAFLRYLLQGEK